MPNGLKSSLAARVKPCIDSPLNRDSSDSNVREQPATTSQLFCTDFGQHSRPTGRQSESLALVERRDDRAPAAEEHLPVR